ncbi:MAG: hypothetical protein LBE83_03525 [Propionibacteriaceae bacterium]|nr:hypothetical protein [Propionibacteriaceae bacterium]
MPTTLERTTVTHTPPVRGMLATAARRWPETTSPRELMVRLMSEGASSLREHELEAAYADAYADWAVSDDAVIWDRASADGLEPAV